MKKIIILVVLMAVLGGGGFFAWTQMSGEEEQAGSEQLRGPNDENLMFVELDPITAPFIRDGRFAQYIVLTISLEVNDDDAKDMVRRNIPRIRDAFLSELHTLAAMRSPRQRLINLSRIKVRLMSGANRVLGRGVVLDILVQLAS